jgi:hypothetical protein
VFVFKDGKRPEYYLSSDYCVFANSAPSFECKRQWHCKDAGEFYVVHNKNNGEVISTNRVNRPQSPVNRNRSFGFGFGFG